MKYSNVFFIFTLVLLFGSTGAQASKWDLCKKIFPKSDCEVYKRAYETLDELQNAKSNIDDLVKQNEDLHNQVKELTMKGNDLAHRTILLSKITQALVQQNTQLKAENGLLQTEAIRYRKFIRMFTAENH